MKPVFNREMLDVMMGIRFNNDKAYMDATRDVYLRKMRQPYYDLINALAPTMLEIDAGMEVRPSKCLSRIFRDTRYSRDKSPYRDHHWVAFRHEGEPRDQSVMYWFEIRLEAVSWGLGFWGENRNAMDAMRRRMEAFPDEFLAHLRLIDGLGFVMEGAQYARRAVPDSIPEELHPWYLKKELYLGKAGIDPEVVFKPGLADLLAADFLALKPVYRLFRGCLDTGVVPMP